MNSTLKQIQTDIFIKLKKEMPSIPVLCQDKSDYQSCLQEKVLHFNGLCIFILSPEPKKAYSQVAKLTYKEVDISIRICENIFFNKTELNTESCKESILKTLHHWKPEVEFNTSPLCYTHEKNKPTHHPYSLVTDIIFNIACDAHTK